MLYCCCLCCYCCYYCNCLYCFFSLATGQNSASTFDRKRPHFHNATSQPSPFCHASPVTGVVMSSTLTRANRSRLLGGNCLLRTGPKRTRFPFDDRGSQSPVRSLGVSGGGGECGDSVKFSVSNYVRPVLGTRVMAPSSVRVKLPRYN